MKRNGVVAWTAGALLTIEEVDLEAPCEGDVPIEVRATGIYRIDRGTLKGPYLDVMKKGDSARSVELH